MKTLKRIAAFCLAVLMTMSIVPITNLSAQPEVDTREGFTLVPTAFGQTGIETTSAFVLTTPTDTMPNLSIDGQPSPAINRTEANRFYITPATPLRANTVYIFRVARANEPDITWAFQTAKNFEILSTLPGNQGAFVPVNVGIEVNFSLGAEVDLESHFTIYPHVEGWFVYDGNTTVFMPISPLAYSTIYTVTIDGDLGLANSAQTLGQDFIFSFETMPQTEEEVEAAFQPRTQVQFTENFVEFPSFEPARIGFRLISNTWDNIPDTEFRVYRFEDLHQAADAVNQIAGIPSWSHFAQIRSLVDTEGLAHVLSFEAESPIRWQTAQASLPEVLPPGFYLINATVGEDSVPRQMVMQITNLAVQVVADDTSAIVWVNHMTTGEPAIGAEIWSSVTENLYTADDDGISVINRGIGDGTGDMLHITAEAEEVAVFFPGWNAWGRAVSPSWGIPNDNYWSVLQLDRTLFSPRDTVSFWGFASPRNGNENTGYLTATIAQGFDIMHREAVATENGGFHGEITLPNLTPGGYNLTISYGDTNITQIFFTVEDFVLPPYQMHTTADQVAVFIGEEATFNVRSEFFEGTPVAELEVIYGFFGSNLQTNAQGQGQTDINGNFARPTGIIQPSGTAQGQATLTFRTEATLPEIGRTFRQASVRVFINDINVAVETSRQGADATVAVNVHEITLDRLNNGTNTHFNDFLADPVPGQALSAAVSRIYWVAERTGEVYDFIQRRVVPVYRHNRHEEIIDRFSLTTDADGYARHDFTVPDRLHESYRITITTTDGNGRTITHQRFIGRDWSSFHWDANDNQMNLHQEQEGDVFAIGDEINLTVRRGVEPLIQGRTLFVMVQNGILTHHVGDNYFDFEFEGGHVPNIAVHAFYFNGHTYYNSFRMTRRIRFDTAERNLNIEITADQESYRPSGTATLTITTTDNEGNPRPANVNISLVDEALFALRDYTVDTLAALFRQINTNLRITRATHRTFISGGIDGYSDDMESDMVIAGEMAVAVPMPPAAAQPDMAGGAEETHLRQNFEETALFATVNTNAQGVATITFDLPDNITSWRVTASAITADFYAGNQTGNIIVTQPMFVHYTLGSLFLVGDAPAIGLNAFGTSFDGSEAVEFRVWNEATPETVHTITASPFERVNLPLPPKTAEGDGAIIVHVNASNGYSDALRHEYTVITSHRLVDTAVFYENITADTAFAMGTDGMAQITFTDQGRGRFLHELMGMRFVRGDRLEGLVMAREATRIINEYFPDSNLRPAPDFDPSIYQRLDGGLAMLPFADSNLATTVAMMPFVIDEINAAQLRYYLNNIFQSETGENKMQALYGLAMLREPVLLDLQRYALLENLTIVDLAYIALGFAALGETTTASNIYANRILPHIQSLGQFYRVYQGETNQQIVDATSAVALLASQLGKPEAMGLHAYVTNNRPSPFEADPMPNAINRLTFISNEIGRLDDTGATITYTLFGQEFTRSISGRRSFTLRLPAENMHHFSLTAVEGAVGAVSIHRLPLEEIDTADNNITVTREFFAAGSNTPTTTFNQDDLIRVVITVNYSATDVQGSYQIIDFLPAGLAHVPNSARFTITNMGWRRAIAQGQTITFFDHNSRFNDNREYVYYARVVSPGTFTAEGTMVQSLSAANNITIGENTVITILH